MFYKCVNAYSRFEKERFCFLFFSHKLFLQVIGFLFFITSAVRAVPADVPPDFVPFGVYLGWELPSHCAAYSGIERWEDICRRLDVCVENHVNTLWVTNMSEEDLPGLISECQRRDLKLIVSMASIEGKIKWRWDNEGAYYNTTIPRVVKLAGSSKALVGWVLSDEPTEEDLPNMEILRQQFRKLDPDRFCLVVTTWSRTPPVPKETNLPVVCTDLYPFFAPDNVNGPHTDVTSQSYFRNNALKMVDAIGEKNAVPWVMGQCFVEIWGPYRYADNSRLIALPGAFFNWRCPTLAEVRWQIWETFRCQSKGIIFFELAPLYRCAPETAEIPSPDVSWKDILLKKSVDAGHAALTTLDAKATPQLEEIGKIFQSMMPFEKLILRWKAASQALVTVQPPALIQCFVDPEDNKQYAVVVNDNLHSSQTIKLSIMSRVDKVVDVIHNNREIVLSSDSSNGTKTGTIELKAGDGTILYLSKAD